MDPAKQQTSVGAPRDGATVNDDVNGQPPNESPVVAPVAETETLSARNDGKHVSKNDPPTKGGLSKDGSGREEQDGVTAVVVVDADAGAKPATETNRPQEVGGKEKVSLKNVVDLSDDEPAEESSQDVVSKDTSTGSQDEAARNAGERKGDGTGGSLSNESETAKEKDAVDATAAKKSSDAQATNKPIADPAATGGKKAPTQDESLDVAATANPKDAPASDTPAPDPATATEKETPNRDETPSNDPQAKKPSNGLDVPLNVKQGGKKSTNGLQATKTIVKGSTVALPMAANDGALNALKKEVSLLNNAVKSISRQMAVIIRNTTKVKDEPSEISKDKTSLQESPRPRKKRKENPAGPTSDICICFESSKIVLLRTTILALVTNFVQSMPSLRLWLSNDANPKAVTASEFSNTQILEQLFFLKTNAEHCPTCAPPGRFIFYIMNKALRHSLSLARKKLDAKEKNSEEDGKPEINPNPKPTACKRVDGRCPVDPKWLSYFAHQRDIDLAMIDAWRTAEGGGTVEKEEPAPAEPANNGEANALDLFCRGEICCHVVDKIRSSWLEVFSACQQNARNQLLNSFGFVLQEIVRRRSQTEARTRGFSVRLNTHSGSSVQHGDGKTEVIWPTGKIRRGTLWDILKASTGAAAAKEDGNINARRRLERAFRSLHCTVEFEKMRYNAATGDSPRSGPGVVALNRRQILTANITEKVSLIEVANGMLMEVFGFDSEKEVLASSALSLKAILVLTIALRGHIVIELKKSGAKSYVLHEREQAALGTRKV